MKKLVIALLLILPLAINAVISNEHFQTLFTKENLDSMNTVKVYVKPDTKKTNKRIILAVQNYLLDQKVYLVDSSQKADFTLSVNTELVRTRSNENQNGYSQLYEVTAKCYDTKTEQIKFISQTEIMAEGVTNRSGLRLKWYEPVLITVAITSLVFGLWNLN